ncbi:MAG: helix-turn-helix domain-containing protein [Acetobacteraceae bacterium]|nr:helix-turn-helix domain-containing protein [Acetobacteraceae bacterium]
MAIMHRPEIPRGHAPRTALNPQPARGFAPRPNRPPADEADEIETDAELEEERAAERAQGRQAPLRPDGRRPGEAGMGPGLRPAAPAEVPAAVASVAPTTPATKADAAPVASTPAPPDVAPAAAAPAAPATPAADAVPPPPIIPAPSPGVGPVAGLGLLSSQEVAAIMRVSLQRLESWRRKGIGPAFIKINARTIHYRAADIDAFLAARLRPGVSA